MSASKIGSITVLFQASAGAGLAGGHVVRYQRLVGYYLIDIGDRPENASGVGSRGWYIGRRRATVTRRWGPIDVVGSRGGKFYWRGAPRELVETFASDTDAAAFVSRKLHEKLEWTSGGYRRLPPPNRILMR